jgi:hypothetical protein
MRIIEHALLTLGKTAKVFCIYKKQILKFQ